MSSEMAKPSAELVQGAARSYKLVFLFDGSQVGKDDLQGKVEKALAQIPGKRLGVKNESAKLIGVHVEGTLEVADKCHAELCDNLLFKTDLRYFRMTDEAGDEVRLRAYPILAGIELQMRGFINRVMVEVSGFEYWKKWRVPSDLQSRIARFPDAAKTELSFDPLQFTQFGDLVALLKVRCPTWAADRSLTPSDLKELLARGKTIDDLRAALVEKTRVVSLWDNVFARYFGDPKDKESLIVALDFVVEQRHSVMHHRPVRLGLLTALKSKEKTVNTMLGAAKEALSPRERREAKADADRLWQSLYNWTRATEAFTQANPRVIEMLNDTARQTALLQPSARLALDQMRYADAAMARALSPELLRHLDISAEQLRRSQQLFADAMGPHMEAAMRAWELMSKSQPGYIRQVQADEKTPEKDEQERPDRKPTIS